MSQGPGLAWRDLDVPYVIFRESDNLRNFAQQKSNRDGPCTIACDCLLRRLLGGRQKFSAAALVFLSKTRYPARNGVIFLLSSKAGLRAKEIARVRWAMLIDAESEVSRAIHLQDNAQRSLRTGNPNAQAVASRTIGIAPRG